MMELNDDDPDLPYVREHLPSFLMRWEMTTKVQEVMAKVWSVAQQQPAGAGTGQAGGDSVGADGLHRDHTVEASGTREEVLKTPDSMFPTVTNERDKFMPNAYYRNSEEWKPDIWKGAPSIAVIEESHVCDAATLREANPKGFELLAISMKHAPSEEILDFLSFQLS